MKTSLFQSSFVKNQSVYLTEIKGLTVEQQCSYMEHCISSIANEARLSKQEIDMVNLMLSAVRNNPHTNDPDNHTILKKGWHEVPFWWRCLTVIIITTAVFCFALIGVIATRMSNFGAAMMPVLGLIIGISGCYLWGRAKFGVGREKGAGSHGNTLNIEDSYKRMLSFADTLDGAISILRQDESTKSKVVAKDSSYKDDARGSLNRDVLLAVQKLLGASRRGDSFEALKDYIEELKESLLGAGIEVIHYSEERSECFEIIEGKKHGTEILPALSEKNGSIVFGKYIL